MNKCIIKVDYFVPIENEMFAYSEDSPSGLIFNKVVYGGKNNKQHLKKVGQAAGSKEYSNKSGEPLAWRVQLLGIRYNVHRLIWILHNKTISEDMVIDHLDGNPFNNIISNLQIKSPRENNQNVKLSSRNKSGVCGVFLEEANNIPIAWTATWSDIDGKPQRKRFYFKNMTNEESFIHAVAFREQKIKELVSLNMTYTDRHGR